MNCHEIGLVLWYYSNDFSNVPHIRHWYKQCFSKWHCVCVRVCVCVRLYPKYSIFLQESHRSLNINTDTLSICLLAFTGSINEGLAMDIRSLLEVKRKLPLRNLAQLQPVEKTLPLPLHLTFRLIYRNQLEAKRNSGTVYVLSKGTLGLQQTVHSLPSISRWQEQELQRKGAGLQSGERGARHSRRSLRCPLLN